MQTHCLISSVPVLCRNLQLSWVSFDAMFYDDDDIPYCELISLNRLQPLGSTKRNVYHMTCCAKINAVYSKADILIIFIATIFFGIISAAKVIVINRKTEDLLPISVQIRISLV